MHEIMYDHRNVPRRPFFGPGPFLGGLLGGFIGSALFGPRPYPLPYYPQPYFGYYDYPPYYYPFY